MKQKPRKRLYAFLKLNHGYKTGSECIKPNYEGVTLSELDVGFVMAKHSLKSCLLYALPYSQALHLVKIN